MQSVVQTEQLTKRFGSTTAIDQLSMEIVGSDRVSMVGQPGAGKSTLLRLLVDLVHPTSGRARVAGFDTRRASYQVRRATAWVPAQVHLPQNLSVEKFLDRSAQFRRTDPNRAARHHILPRLDLAPDDKIADLDQSECHVGDGGSLPAVAAGGAAGRAAGSTGPTSLGPGQADRGQRAGHDHPGHRTGSDARRTSRWPCDAAGQGQDCCHRVAGG